MVSPKYCYYWIPVTTHTNLELIREKPINCYLPIDEIGHVVTINVILREERKKSSSVVRYDLQIHSQVRLKSGQLGSGSEQSCDLFLENTDYSQNGIIEYRFNEGVGAEYETIEVELVRNIYHHVKSFFHKHTFHQKNTSYLFEALVCKRRIDIHKNDNKVLTHFLAGYEFRFASIHDNMMLMYRLVEEHEPNSFDDDIANQLDIRRQLNEAFMNFFGEKIYYNCLFYSQYNASCVLRTEAPNPDKKLHRIALNIHNLFEKIEMLQRQNLFLSEYQGLIQTHSMLKTAKKASNTAWWMAVIFGVVSVISGIITYLQWYDDKLPRIEEELSRQQIKIEAVTLHIKEIQADSRALRTVLDRMIYMDSLNWARTGIIQSPFQAQEQISISEEIFK
ncbi:hypothetical protein [Alistipes sp.]|uniref:hypothetical protein n=1 Tax=Alistipes sp. TaxID=1872444 RepID=UPI003AEF5222